ncbi:histidine decarboxylase, pyruvoyl type [Saccharothrix obliqua]|uniref:histidine decarboxylase, pyruvoyl type n=1 Tax=Saccharothrix obliqua TaxID=2861747 RepID=UPI001C5FA129|nr:histidine decarboxylase, pyruvoyl type [Saccharothrix obliqua]MBW4717161.1 histidine decarboxylase, pyruvoyl type [Saccharothrix obliqua]
MSRNPTSRVDRAILDAIGAEPAHASGYGTPIGRGDSLGSAGTGYIATMKLSVGKVLVGELDEGTEGIVSYDRCEANDANISQINMVTASSFCGLNGALWGYDLAVADLPDQPLFTSRDLFSDAEVALFAERGKSIDPVAFHSAGPLLAAAERLFGHSAAGERRHPPLPGAQVVCANKSAVLSGPKDGPGYAWAIIGIAISPDREANACLFIEDCGTAPTMPPHEMVEYLKTRRDAVAKSMTLCGQDYDGVRYPVAYIAAKAIHAERDEVACALACAPYVLLATDSVPGRDPARLRGMSLKEWEEQVWPDTAASFRTADTGVDGVHVAGGPVGER